MLREIVSPTVTGKARIPPGQYKTDKFPVLDLGIHPPFDPKTWKFQVWGDVESAFVLSWPEFQNLPRIKLKADFHCVTRWSRLELGWEGVHVRTIFEKARPKKGAGAVMCHSADGYTTNVTMKDLDDEDVILADTLDGKPLPVEHGGPLRLIVPKLYGWKSAKFLIGLEFLREDKPGYWEERGYHMRGEYWAEQRYWD